MKYFLALLLLAYFVLSGYTVSEDADGVRSAADRIILADMLGIVIALTGLVTLRRVQFTAEYFFFLCFLAVALIGVFNAQNPQAGTVELLVLAFNMAVSLALLNLVLNNPQITIQDVVGFFVVGSAVLAVAGLVQFFLLPNLFVDKPGGAVTGTFRNTGQAGAYFGVALAVAIPALMSGLIKRNTLNIVSIALLVTALLFTFKRAALIGFTIGIGLFALRLAFVGSARDRKIAVGFIFLCLIAGPLLYYLFQYSIEHVESMRWRFEYKFREDAIEDFSEGFFGDNLAATFRALNEHPLLGAGLGNIIGQYTTKYEIHSTYLSVLANTGVFGFGFYAVFMAVWIFHLMKSAGKASIEARFLSYFLPFLVGLGVSWMYTYHLRKREFWILFVISIACRLIIERKNVLQSRPLPVRRLRDVPPGTPAMEPWITGYSDLGGRR